MVYRLPVSFVCFTLDHLFKESHDQKNKATSNSNDEIGDLPESDQHLRQGLQARQALQAAALRGHASASGDTQPLGCGGRPTPGRSGSTSKPSRNSILATKARQPSSCFRAGCSLTLPLGGGWGARALPVYCEQFIYLTRQRSHKVLR
jgi:hypothetical protein